MVKGMKVFFPLLAVLLALAGPVYGQEKGGPPGPPPSPVVVSGVDKGMIAPQGEFVGTVYYMEVSEVSSEVSGKVEAVRFDDGKRVKKGEALTEVDRAILLKEIEALKGVYGQARTDLEKARADFKRIEGLYRQELVSESDYDTHRFRVSGLEKRADSLKAELGRLDEELLRKTVRAPFDGVVIRKKISPGEWVQPGTPVATIARDDFVDIVVNVPEEITRFTGPGASVEVTAGGRKLNGKVMTIIPRGEVLTRTFPVKVRAENTGKALVEGMEARVTLPQDREIETLVVSRDAVITMFGMTVVFAVVDGTARMTPVRVVGYDGMKAGVASDALKEGMQVVVKGNERLKDGQPVSIVGGK